MTYKKRVDNIMDIVEQKHLQRWIGEKNKQSFYILKDMFGYDCDVDISRDGNFNR